MQEDVRRALVGVSAIIGLSALGVAAIAFMDEPEGIAVAVVNAVLDLVIALKAKQMVEDGDIGADGE